MQRPFKVLGVQQIAIGASDKNEIKKLWQDMLGFSYKSTFISFRLGKKTSCSSDPFESYRLMD